MLAATDGNMEIIGLLINNGADKLLRDKNGETAADWAKRGGHGQIALFCNKIMYGKPV